MHRNLTFHSKIIELMQELDYIKESKGVCLGVVGLAIAMFFKYGNLNLFNMILRDIYTEKTNFTKKAYLIFSKIVHEKHKFITQKINLSCRFQ